MRIPVESALLVFKIVQRLGRHCRQLNGGATLMTLLLTGCPIRIVQRVDDVAPGSYFVAMHAVGLKVLKNRLSEYVRLAASGETILVTDRERVVAELVPPRAGRAPLANDALVAEAVRKGWLTPALGARDESVPRRPVTTLAHLITELERDRADR